jgi:hypothetical protein
VSLLTISRAPNFIKQTVLISLLMFLTCESAFSWEIDLSRRRKANVKSEAQKPLNINSEGGDTGFIRGLFSPSVTSQEIVVIQTDKGFLPSTLRLRKGNKYLIHVVNVNEKEKNVSFILDAFSQYFATFYGKVKSFEVEPKKEGVFTFQSPETAIEGKVVIVGEESLPQEISKPEVRAPAQE